MMIVDDINREIDEETGIRKDRLKELKSNININLFDEEYDKKLREKNKRRVNVKRAFRKGFD